MNFFFRPAIHPGWSRRSRRSFRNAQFESFLAQNNRKRLDTDFQDAVLRGRRLARRVLALLVAGGAAWVLIESARALTMF